MFFEYDHFNNWTRFDKTTGMYAPHNKAWIKEKIYALLRQQAGKA